MRIHQQVQLRCCPALSCSSFRQPLPLLHRLLPWRHYLHLTDYCEVDGEDNYGLEVDAEDSSGPEVDAEDSSGIEVDPEDSSEPEVEDSYGPEIEVVDYNRIQIAGVGILDDIADER